MTEFEKELVAIQTWIKATAKLNSYVLTATPPQLARPVIVWEIADRQPKKNLSQYVYTIPVRQYGKLHVNSVSDAMIIQDALIKDLEERYGVIPITENGVVIAKLKNTEMQFQNDSSLDVAFSIYYEVTYGRTRPQEAPKATNITSNISTSYERS